MVKKDAISVLYRYHAEITQQLGDEAHAPEILCRKLKEQQEACLIAIRALLLDIGYEEAGFIPGEFEGLHNDVRAKLDKLAEYESIGLTPTEVRELADAKANNRLIVIPESASAILVWPRSEVPGIKGGADDQ